MAVAVAVAGTCSSNSTPILGTSICCKCGPKKQKKKGGGSESGYRLLGSSMYDTGDLEIFVSSELFRTTKLKRKSIRTIFFFFFYTEVELIYNVVFVFAI